LSSRQPRRKTITELTEIFLWKEERKADKTSCVQLHGNTYEVDLELVGNSVLLRHDPFDLKVIQVWWKEKRFPDVGPVDLTRPYHRKVTPVQKHETEDQISFFDLAEARRRVAWEEQSLSFVRKEDVQK